MEEDDVSGNIARPYYPKEPAEQTKDRAEEKAKVLQSQTVIREQIARMDERIKFRDSIEAIDVNLREDPAMHQKKCEVNDMLKLALEEEKRLLEDLLSTYT